MATARVTIGLLALGVALAMPRAGVARAGAGRTVHLTVGPFVIEPHRDREVCRAVRLPRVAGLQVEQWEARSRTARRGQVGTHHFVAYGYSGGGAAALPGPRALVDDPGCSSLGPADFFTKRVFLAGSGGESQRGRWLVTTASMPPGLSQPMPTLADAPDEAVVILNSHYFNASERPAKGFVKLTLRLAPLDPAKRPVRQMTEVTASRDIKVAPGAVGPAVTATWAADGARNDATEGGVNPADDVCILALSPHMHKRGTLFTIDYEEDGGAPQRLHATTDYLHPGSVLLPFLGTSTPGLLRASSAANGHPRIRYSCLHANGAAAVEPKMGCEELAGVTPGRSAAEAHPGDGQLLGNADHARPCGLDGANCRGHGTERCVPANLVFGPLSDDEMCILVAMVYEPRRDVAPELACHPSY
jgi:hypothetical protein